ncbi:MAG TPA: hypothetical protein VFB81_05725, partial [Myxococcales bacterium]|nr:hypothetical protein [Myxococcales bacterium]
DRMLALDLDPGLYTGVLSESPEQTLGAVTLVREKDLTGEGELPFGEMDPILFSELVRDLEGLRG